MENSKQHVQLPNNMTKNKEIAPKDLLVYLAIKSHINKDTKECFPSLKHISDDCGYSIPSVRKSISVLEKLEYLKIRKEGRKQIYRFGGYKNFEPFSYTFLENKKIETNEKSYLIALQQIMIKDSKGFGKISYSDEKIADMLNLSSKTVGRINKSLEEKGFLTLVKTNKKDLETGIFINEKFYHLDELGQSIIWSLNKHEKEIKDLQESVNKDNKILITAINSLQKDKKDQDKVLQKAIQLLKKFGLSEDDILNDESIIL